LQVCPASAHRQACQQQQEPQQQQLDYTLKLLLLDATRPQNASHAYLAPFNRCSGSKLAVVTQKYISLQVGC
jgi:hypothetical protein